jgi:microcystin-dependent protein
VSTPFLGEIRLFPYNFAPNGWAFCQGQTLPISQNTALFSLLGTTYGGNGTTTFMLPDLRGRLPIGSGVGAGLSTYDLGEVGGAESVTISALQMPAHTHLVQASSKEATGTKPGGSVLGRTAARTYEPAPDGVTHLNTGSLTSAGGGQPTSVIQPYLALNFCIALTGIYPSRN